jgi:AAA family ATP:ADP antiporter
LNDQIIKPTVLTTLDRLLGIFAKVHAREGVTSLLLMFNIFLILLAYYFIKPVREGWLSVSVIAGLSKIEIKAYSAFGQSLLLLAILPLYSKLAASYPRRKLITVTGIICAITLAVFWLLQPGLLISEIPFSGVMFYMFVGLFSVTLIAQFWSFAADLFGQDKGRRLFPLIAVGASLGAVVGSWLGERLIRTQWLDSFDLILLALVPLGCSLYLTSWIDQRGTLGQPSEATLQRWDEPAAPEGHGAFKTITESRYLLATSGMILLFSWIVASGDNILFGMIQEVISADLVAITNPEDLSQAVKTATTAFYSDLYFWINLIGLLLQAFIVSRLIQFGGFSLLVLATPLISLVAYFSMAIAPVLGIIKFMKIAENSSNYSINNTARHMLWLPTTKAMLYQAKATVDTLFVRIGDGLAALIVLLGTRVWSFSLFDFLIINIVLSLIWTGFAIYLSREYRRMDRENQAGAIPLTTT